MVIPLVLSYYAWYSEGLLLGSEVELAQLELESEVEIAQLKLETEGFTNYLIQKYIWAFFLKQSNLLR